ncbi:DEAD/DEAH box helicase [Leifsonia sp. H3M29-4]|uniref:DEAD/DEAH box helicase n=1 Tax=Salinibacterium metalliresistens TaxID=3031321 RepID=UPI0023DCA8CD|nr:DEAD/DEAH box helicase [Salinibacterium metalliresistens]MDF1479947.1 DEAD/DEAH box helicase [Salinibacterium metalliresistens]
MSDQLSPAERFAASKRRSGHPVLEAFRAAQRFDLDPFQIAACEVVEDGKSVLVAAPTGAGKTVVAEFAIYRAMQQHSDKVFYTAPMKALSNQKFNELVAEYGADQVGLLTGDTNINSHARVVVMTTEVLRNMLYADSDLLKNLSCVVMDEVHFLADRFRGAVWEEVIIHLPPHVTMVSLSATVSNAEEFGDWLQAVRGDTEVIVSEERPVPLDQHILMRTKLIDLFDSSGLAATHRVNPELVQMARYGGRTLSSRQMKDVGRYHSRGGRPENQRMLRGDVVKLLDSKNLLPAIFFVFSRAGCDQAVQQVLRSGVKLTTQPERDEIRAIVEERCRTLLDEDLAVLGYWDWLSGLERGVASHHAGLLPAFKEVVEELFQKKLVKVVFATETLALGINMPARTVVLEKLEKFNGEARVPITPGEYTQLTGRAGRRGIDVEGHSVIQWVDGLDPQAVASLASRRTYPLNSSFKPTYNMAVNLIAQFGRERTREILESSFAQFQADRAVVDLARKVRSQEDSLAGYRKSMTCHLGDFVEYSTIRRELTDLERKGLSNTASRAERDKRQRQLQELRRRMKQHPCHACPEREQHARWAERYWKLKRETNQLSQQIRSRTGAVAKIFDRVTDVLVELGYVTTGATDLELTAPGRMLRRIYGERDLLVAESLRRGFWDELDAASLAAMATTLVYEPRREEGQLGDRHLPRGRFREAFDRTGSLWSDLDDLERRNKLPGSQPLSTGLALAMYRWASGTSLDAVLREADMAAGDFVRWSKQTIDLLDQLSVVADGEVGRTARRALDQIRRGIVAYSSVA